MLQLRIVFLSAANISVPCLECLKVASNVSLCGIMTQPGRMKGRGQKWKLNPIGAWAQDNGIDFYQAEKMDENAFNWMSALKPDLAFVMAFGHILKKKFLDLPPLGMWNFHASLLPKYRGASPIQTVLLNGETQTGVTLMSMVEALDAGAYLSQETVAIDPKETALTLTEKLAQASVILLKKSLPQLISNHYILISQNKQEVSFCKKFSKADGLLDFSMDAMQLERQIRAFQPWPGSYFFRKGKQYLVHQAHIEVSSSYSPGKFFTDMQAKTLCVATAKGTLVIDRIQRSGGKPLPAAEFLRGAPNFFN